MSYRVCYRSASHILNTSPQDSINVVTMYAAVVVVIASLDSHEAESLVLYNDDRS